MAKFMYRVQYSQDGVAGSVKEGFVNREAYIRGLIESMGGTVESVYWGLRRRRRTRRLRRRCLGGDRGFARGLDGRCRRISTVGLLTAERWTPEWLPSPTTEPRASSSADPLVADRRRRETGRAPKTGGTMDDADTGSGAGDAGFLGRVQSLLDSVTEGARALKEAGEQKVADRRDQRERDTLLRELGELYYEALSAGEEQPARETRDRLMADLDEIERRSRSGSDAEE